MAFVKVAPLTAFGQHFYQQVGNSLLVFFFDIRKFRMGFERCMTIIMYVTFWLVFVFGNNKLFKPLFQIATFLHFQISPLYCYFNLDSYQRFLGAFISCSFFGTLQWSFPTLHVYLSILCGIGFSCFLKARAYWVQQLFDTEFFRVSIITQCNHHESFQFYFLRYQHQSGKFENIAYRGKFWTEFFLVTDLEEIFLFTARDRYVRPFQIAVRDFSEPIIMKAVIQATDFPGDILEMIVSCLSWKLLEYDETDH